MIRILRLRKYMCFELTVNENKMSMSKIASALARKSAINIQPTVNSFEPENTVTQLNA